MGEVTWRSTEGMATPCSVVERATERAGVHGSIRMTPRRGPCPEAQFPLPLPLFLPPLPLFPPPLPSSSGLKETFSAVSRSSPPTVIPPS